MKIYFGPFAFDLAAREVRRGPDVLHLSPKAFNLLELLVRERPRALSKRELFDSLWPDVVVEEQNLKNLIVEIRAVLREEDGDRRYIRTVRKFGYAFSAEAREEGSTEVSSGPASRLQATGRSYLLRPGANLIGRDPDVAVRIIAPEISRHHARIIVTSDQARLEDLGSKNGTWVGGQRVSGPVELRDGDQVRFGGKVRLTFRLRGSEESTLSE